MTILTCNTCSLSQIFMILRICGLSHLAHRVKYFGARTDFERKLCLCVPWGWACRSHVQFSNCALSLQLGEQLAQLVPASGVDVVELEDEGTCVRFSPLMTSAGNIHSSQPLVSAGLCSGMVQQSLGSKGSSGYCPVGRIFFKQSQTTSAVLFCCTSALGALMGPTMCVMLPHCLCREELPRYFLNSLGKAAKFLLSAA